MRAGDVYTPKDLDRMKARAISKGEQSLRNKPISDKDVEYIKLASNAHDVNIFIRIV
jgi:hypothetical protein